MKCPLLLIVVVSLFAAACVQSTEDIDKIRVPFELSKDKNEIQNLTRQMMNWAEVENLNALTPTYSIAKDSLVSGIDFEAHKSTLAKFRTTQFFTRHFIANFDRIVVAIDKKIKNKEFPTWRQGQLPPFDFGGRHFPWTFGRGKPYERPNPWDLLAVNVKDLQTGECEWKWGGRDDNTNYEVRNFTYSFRVKKENRKWKIDAMQGFDYNQIIGVTTK